MDKVLVTGASGMIGATMIEQMLKDGINVTAIIRPRSHKRCNLPVHAGLDIIECDIGSLLTLKNKVGKGYDVFYHFA